MKNEIETESAAPETVPETAEAAPASKPKPKRRWLKVTLWILGGLFGIVVLILCFRDVLVEKAIIHVGSRVAGVRMSIGSFESSLLGSVEIRDFKIANPPGYIKDNAFEIGHLHVKIDLPTVLTQKIIIDTVLVEGMRVDFETKITKTNLGEIQDNVNNFLGINPDGSAKDEDDDDKNAEEEPKQLIIRDLRLSDNNVQLHGAPIPLAPMHLTNLGEGKSIGETFNSFYAILMKGITNSVTAIGGAMQDAGNSFLKLIKLK